MTEDDVREELRRTLKAWRSQKLYAAHIRVSEQYVSDVLAGRRLPGPAVLGALGLRKVVRYEREAE